MAGDTLTMPALEWARGVLGQAESARRVAYRTAVATLLPALRGERGAAVADVPADVLWRAARASFTTAPVSAPGLLPPVPPAGFRRTLVDLLADIPATGVLAVPTFTPAPAPGQPHAEGAAKTEATLNFSPRRDVPLRSVATIVHCSDELLDDAGQLAAWLDRYLEYLVAVGEERQILIGDDTGANVLGYFSWPGIPAFVPPNKSTIAGQLAAAAAQVAIASGGVLADTYVVSAADWALLAAENQPTLDPDGMRLHGCDLIASPALTSGQMLVGACQSASVLGRSGGLRIETTNSHDVNFTKDISSIRAASRLALGVLQPSAFVKV